MSNFVSSNEGEDMEALIQLFWEDPDAMINPIEEFMGEIETNMERISKELKSEGEAEKSDADEVKEIAQDGVAAAAAENDEKAKLSMVTVGRELERMSDSFKEQLEKQKGLLNQLDRLQKSNVTLEENKRKLADLKLQIEESGNDGKRLMNDIRRLDVDTQRMLYDDMEIIRKMLLEVRTNYLEKQKANESSGKVTLTENDEFREVMKVRRASIELMKQRAKLNEIGIKVHAHNKKNAEAQRKIENLQDTEVGSRHIPDLVEWLESNYEAPFDMSSLVDELQNTAELAKMMRGFQRDLALMGESDGAEGIIAVQSRVQSAQERIQSLTQVLDIATQKHKDLKSEQAATSAKLDGMKHYKGAISEGINRVNALKMKFEEIDSARIEMKKKMFALVDKADELESVMSKDETNELMDKIEDELETLKEIEIDNLRSLSSIKCMEQAADACKDDPHCQTM